MNIVELKKLLERSSNEQDKISLQGKINTLRNQAESHIRTAGRDINFSTRDWSIEMILDKFETGMSTEENELFIPDYQREFKWSDRILSRFIESILLDFPIPYLYIADVDSNDNPELDGRIEIIDGSQRIRALHYFVSNQVALTDLKEIKELEGFYFSDLSAGRRRRFMRETLRLVELKGAVDEGTRRDLFDRINSGAKRLEAMEIRHGSQEADSRFYKEVITECSESDIFSELAPLSVKKKANADHKELTLRFFAYLNNLDKYDGKVKPFLDDYLAEVCLVNSDSELTQLKDEFYNAMSFIKAHLPMGFRKTPTSNTTYRARYEALAVGTAFALRVEDNLEPATPISEWIASEDFLEIVSADSANNTSQLHKRINYVKNKLLGL